MSAITTKGGSRPISAYLYKRPKLKLLSLIALPMFWIVGVYIFSLFLLLITAFWFVDPFTSKVIVGFTLENFVSLFTVPAYLSTSIRTLLIALAVTGLSVLFAVPLGIYMAKIARPWVRNALAVLLPCRYGLATSSKLLRCALSLQSKVFLIGHLRHLVYLVQLFQYQL